MNATLRAAQKSAASVARAGYANSRYSRISESTPLISPTITGMIFRNERYGLVVLNTGNYGFFKTSIKWTASIEGVHDCAIGPPRDRAAGWPIFPPDTSRVRLPRP